MVVAIVVAVNFAAKAQTGSSGGGGFDDEPEDVPVEGGIILLAGAGAYGYKKIKIKSTLNNNNL